jgi:uncharacterized protein
MPISHLDGPLLRQGIVAASQRLIQMQAEIDKINIFPVPDGDTGTNMALTMRSVADGVLNCEDASLHEISAMLAKSALAHAHGSSGAILAQFFQGLSEGFRGQTKCDLACFSRAVRVAADLAREAVSEPHEGTILTVMRDWAEYIQKNQSIWKTFPQLISRSLGVATDSLAKTREGLDVLAAAGVVDAGAQGFVSMLEGIVGFIRLGKIGPSPGSRLAADSKGVAAVTSASEVRFQFCSQIQICGTKVDRVALKSALRPFGDSLIVAGTEELVHVHIHTNEFEEVLKIAGNYGRIENCNKQDMRQQSRLLSEPSGRQKIAIITDSSCDLPADEIISRHIRVVPCRVIFGNESYLDKVTITHTNFYRMLSTSEVQPKTSQPAPADFRDACLGAAAQHDAAIAITVSKALSGTWRAAEVAAQNTGEQIQVTVVDSKSISGGLGLIVLEAAEAAASGAGLEQILMRVDWAVRNVRVFGAIKSVKYLVRSGRVSKLAGKLARLFRLSPILTLDAEGKVQVVTKVFGATRARRKLMKIVRQEATDGQARFLVCDANAPDTAAEYVHQIRKYFGVEEVLTASISPTLGAYLGPGAAVVVFLSGCYRQGGLG